MNNLLYEYNNTFFQIDCLLIFQHQLYLFEVKNYEGEFYVESNKWFNSSGKEIKKPILQLSRSESLLRQMLQEISISFPIKAYVVFIHPEFTLFQAPLNSPIILPTQLNRFMNQLKNQPFTPSNKHFKLAEKLNSLQKTSSPFMRIPKYDYHSLKKGIFCRNCREFLSVINKNYFLCEYCGQKEKIDSAILRTVEDFKLLFPDKKVTVNTILEWCHTIPSPKTIRRILVKNFTRLGHGKYSYYVNREKA
jgi:hypothetical protein